MLESIAIQMKRTVSTPGTGPKAGPQADTRLIESLRLSGVQQGVPAGRREAITTGLSSVILASLAKAGAGAGFGAGAG
ncbi:MAG: hypothetical protein ISP99_07915, partial [Pseudomonadales bacterium]|nr:hypothetical protein [Pseudomonadales bacterium]